MSIYEEIKTPLVMTPTPTLGESVLGYSLRLSEANGCKTPISVLTYAGFNENQARQTRLSLAKLSTVLRQSAEELKAAGLDDALPKGSGRYTPVMGKKINAIYMHSKRTGVCPECVREHQHISVFNEIKYAHACPIHGKKLLFQCPECGKEINWLRLGLTRCSCGADWRHLEMPDADASILPLLKLLWSKVYEKDFPESELKAAGYPVEDLKAMSLNTLLAVIYRIGAFYKGCKDEMEREAKAIKTTAEILSRWPMGYWEYIEREHVPNANFAKSGLRGQFNQFYESFFKNIHQQNEMAFMQKAFMDFGAKRWGKAILHHQMDKDKTFTSPKIFNMKSLAKYVGVRPVTLKKLINQGLVRLVKKPSNANHQQFELLDEQPYIIEPGRHYSFKEAAEILNITVKELQAFLADRYQVKFLAKNKYYLHQKDLDALEELMQ